MLDGLGQMRVPEVVFAELHAILNRSEEWEEEIDGEREKGGKKLKKGKET